jgi:hypothetical protein
MLHTRRRKQRGFVILLYTLMMLFIIIPMAGLAIDAGILYTIKAKLQSSVDGASLGAARSLNRGQDLNSQQSAATDTANRYYHANFPDKWMGVTPIPDPTVDWSRSTASTAVIDVTGSVNSPTWFMRILGFNTVHLVAIGEATRRDVDVMIVIDRSSSLSLSGSCPSLISGAQLFVNSFSNNRDVMGLTTFGTYFNVDFPLNADFQDSTNNGANSLASVVLPKLVCAGFTNGAAGFSTAYQALKTKGDRNALNVILFFTDGQPNTITFGPDYGTGTGPALIRKASSTCKPTAPALGFSGVLAGDVGFNIKGGIFRAKWQGSASTAYPAPGGGGDFTAAFTIQPGEHGNNGNTTNGGNCDFNTTTSTFNNDITAIPSMDSFGNSTTTTWSGGSESGFPASVNTANIGSQQDLENAGINTLDNAAQNARSDALANALPMVVYTIGLGNSGGVNDELLKRVANDPGSGVHQTAYPDGTYIYTPDTAHLASAFAAIADDIMRISK